MVFVSLFCKPCVRPGRVFFEEVENVSRPDHVQLIRRVARRTPSRCRTEGVTPLLPTNTPVSTTRKAVRPRQSLTTLTTSADDYATLSSGFAASLLCVQRMTAAFLEISTPHRRGQSPRLRPALRRTSRHCCPFCWLFVCFPQALPIDNYKNMRRCPPTPIHLTGRPAEAAVARTDATHIVTA